MYIESKTHELCRAAIAAKVIARKKQIISQENIFAASRSSIATLSLATSLFVVDSDVDVDEIWCDGLSAFLGRVVSRSSLNVRPSIACPPRRSQDIRIHLFANSSSRRFSFTQEVNSFSFFIKLPFSSRHRATSFNSIICAAASLDVGSRFRACAT